MYEINDESETLIKRTELCIERKGMRTIYFRLHEIVAPVVEEKYVAVPMQTLDVNRAKESFVIRGSNETEVTNKFIAQTRHIEKISEMFEESKRRDKEPDSD